MTRLFSAIKTDVTVQVRNKLYAIGIGVAVLVAVMLAWLAEADQLPSVVPALMLLVIGGTTLLYVAGMILFWDHPLAVVPDSQAGRLLDSNPRHADGVGAGVKAVLDQLGQGLARVGLAQRQPTDQLERIVNPELPRVHASTSRSCPSSRASRS